MSARELNDEEVGQALVDIKRRIKYDNLDTKPLRSGNRPAGENATTKKNNEAHESTTCLCCTKPIPVPGPGPLAYLIPNLPTPPVILKSYSDFEPWFQALLAVANALGLTALFLDLLEVFHCPNLLRSSPKLLGEMNSHQSFRDTTPEGETVWFQVLARPVYPVLWDHFPHLFVHRLSVAEQKSLIARMLELDRAQVAWGEDDGWGYKIVWNGPSREKERVLGMERMTGGERWIWEKMVKRDYELALDEYERQVCALGQMRAWLGGAVDGGLMRRVMGPVKKRGRNGGRRDDDVGEWGEAGGLRKLVFGCILSIARDEDERKKGVREGKEGRL